MEFYKYLDLNSLNPIKFPIYESLHKLISKSFDQQELQKRYIELKMRNSKYVDVFVFFLAEYINKKEVLCIYKLRIFLKIHYKPINLNLAE